MYVHAYILPSQLRTWLVYSFVRYGLQNVHMCTYLYMNLLLTVGISQVNGIELQCNLVNIINQCTVTWSWNSLLENVTNFLIISNVGRFNVSSQNTSHTFTVLSLPGGASSGEVTVIVIAMNELDQGPPSEVVRTNITGKLQTRIIHVYMHM